MRGRVGRRAEPPITFVDPNDMRLLGISLIN